MFLQVQQGVLNLPNHVGTGVHCHFIRIRGTIISCVGSSWVPSGFYFSNLLVDCFYFNCSRGNVYFGELLVFHHFVTQGSQVVLKVLNCEISFQNHGKVLSLAKTYIWKSVETPNSANCLFKFCSLPLIIVWQIFLHCAPWIKFWRSAITDVNTFTLFSIEKVFEKYRKWFLRTCGNPGH